MHASYRRFVVLLAAVSALAADPLAAQAPAGSIERIRVPGPSLEGNLSGDDATRDVFVYLPPSYSRDTRQRYPVVVFLHGYTATAESRQPRARAVRNQGAAIFLATSRRRRAPLTHRA